MAVSKTHFHVRSNSFPSKSHPLLQHCNDQLERIGSSNATSSSSLAKKLSGAEDLLGCVEKLLQLQCSQQAFSQGRGESWADRIVDGSLRLLETCSVAKDAVLLVKECAREVQSAVRRRRDGLETEIKKYLASRKLAKKMVQKALKGLKMKSSLSFEVNQDNEVKGLVNILCQVETVTLSVFESLLLFISGPKSQNKFRGWSLVSNLMHNKGEEKDHDSNEFANVDASLNYFSLCHENVQSDLRSLELCVQEFEERLESLFRHLIRNRVSLLNILNI